MEPFTVTILGCGSALPTPHHFCASQVVELRGKSYMIDCGEGTQYQMRLNRISFQRLGHVFISHLHGDHWFGLIGMISSFALLGRTATLHIHAPIQLQSTLNHLLQNYCSEMPYPVEFHSIDTTIHQLIHEDKSIQVYSLPLTHTVPCCGFLFKEIGTGRHIKRDAINFYNIPIWAINTIRSGEDWKLEDGTIVPNNMLTTPPTPTRSYAYCSDTAYQPELASMIMNVTALFHESTYADDMEVRANLYKHSTAKQAALIARKSNANLLILGHYSQRYEKEDIFLREAMSVFENVILSKENLTIKL